MGDHSTAARMVTHQPKVGHPQEGSMLHTRNLALKLKSINQKLRPGDSRMVTHHLQDGQLEFEFDSSAGRLVKSLIKSYNSRVECQE